jgi:exonuclease SbcC
VTARDRALDVAGLTLDEAAAVLRRPVGWADAARASLDALATRRARAAAAVDERGTLLADHDRDAPALAAGDLDGEADPGSGGEAGASVRRALAAVAASVPGGFSAGAAAAAAEVAARRVDGLQREATVVAERLRADDDARTLRIAADADVAAAEAAAVTDRVLADLIGSHDGKAFRTFAQSLTLDALLVVANDHLSQLQPRYQLERVPGHDLELQAVDRDLGDEIRSVSSLSGGESFLVSLALALALSSVSARNVRVGTLLIDEGFGTLDPAALDTALAVLDALQATGCQVGLISHVPGLIERVGAHVVVRPLGGGRSAVEVRAA